MSLVTDNANHGFTITPVRSRRYPAEKVTDADFAADISLLSNTIIDKAQQNAFKSRESCRRSRINHELV